MITQAERHSDYLRRTLGKTVLLDEQIPTIVTDAVARYTEEGRYYHNLDHAVEVVAYCDKESKLWSISGPDRAALLLAALWHDVIYDATNPKGYNERLSANHARDLCIVSGIPRKIGERVEALIMETVEHTTDSGDIVTQTLIDADLARFAEPSYSDFVKNNDDIRLEYAHVSDADWLAGRSAVLMHYLLRDPFFYLAPTRMTDQATLNIVRSLRELEKLKK